MEVQQSITEFFQTTEEVDAKAGRSAADSSSQVSARFAISNEKKHCTLEGCKLKGRVFKSPERQHKNYAHEGVKGYDREKHLHRCKRNHAECYYCNNLKSISCKFCKKTFKKKNQKRDLKKHMETCKKKNTANSVELHSR